MAEMFDLEVVEPLTPEALRRQEIEELKYGWSSDPCFDIEDTEGFEDVREELDSFRVEMEYKWAEEKETRLRHLAKKFGFNLVGDGLYEGDTPTHVIPRMFASEMEKLLERIGVLEDRLEQAEIKLDKIGRG